MAAVALACESQSTKSVGCSAAARHAAKFTAVVVFPTPPFWFAMAMMRAKLFSRTSGTYQTPILVARCFTWNILWIADLTRHSNLFHVEHQTSVRARVAPPST